MGALATTGAQVPQTTSIASQGDARKVAAALERVRHSWLDYFSEAEALDAEFPRWTRRAYLVEDSSFMRSVWRERDRLSVIDLAQQARAELPSTRQLTWLRDETKRLLEQRFERATTRLLVGLMTDAFPNARPHSPTTYFETLASELEASGYPLAAIARGLNDIVRKAKFAPSVSEVLESCAGPAETVRNRIANAERGLVAIQKIEARLAELDGQAPITPEMEEAERSRMYPWAGSGAAR